MSTSGSTEVSKVQVGCGPKNILSDWWNVDIRDFPGIDQVMDVTQPWPWEGRLQYVYGEHFLEHLTLLQALKFLEFAAKALRPGGRIRLSTPALEWVLKSHFRFDPTRAVDDTFATNRAFRGWGHQFLYSREMLVRVLEAAGYTNVEFFDYRSSNTADLCDLERHGGWSTQAGYPSVWIVEAERGQSIDIDANFVAEVEDKYGRYVASGH